MDDGDGLAQLLLDGAGGLEHQINYERLYSVPVRSMDLVHTIIRHSPVSLHVVLESNRSSNL